MPASPKIRSLPASPKRESLPSPPRKSSPLSPPRIVSLSACPRSPSLPTPPIMESFPSPELTVLPTVVAEISIVSLPLPLVKTTCSTSSIVEPSEIVPLLISL